MKFMNGIPLDTDINNLYTKDISIIIIIINTISMISL